MEKRTFFGVVACTFVCLSLCLVSPDAGTSDRPAGEYLRYESTRFNTNRTENRVIISCTSGECSSKYYHESALVAESDLDVSEVRKLALEIIDAKDRDDEFHENGLKTAKASGKNLLSWKLVYNKKSLSGKVKTSDHAEISAAAIDTSEKLADMIIQNDLEVLKP